MANTTTREAQQRARAKLAERRQKEDELIDAVTQALATREEATAALAAADTSLADAVAGLADLGIGRDELAAILEVPADQLGGRTRGRPKKSAPSAPVTPTDEAPVAAETDGAEDAAAKPARPRKARAASRPGADGA